ncbi:methyltransferase TYW3-domain-containing protein [Xylariaceae sp. FL0016]|nr:methyltransferase TYW3-domain-containing protein [Xylariaceae sp. FL0016]
MKNFALPSPPAHFARRKAQILEQLAVPDAEYTDASPKGSVDAGIRELISQVNALDGFVTTSSCAGRVSIFVEGKKAGTEPGADDGGDGSGDDNGDGPKPATVAGVGGKGGGGKWLYVSHDPVPMVEGHASDENGLFGLSGCFDRSVGGEMRSLKKDNATRLIHFKFEPMILHVLTASLEHAQLILQCGLQAGFRESGAINLISMTSEPATPIVAIRSMGLAFESLIGFQDRDGHNSPTVTNGYLDTLACIGNERFQENEKRIKRFQEALMLASQPPKKQNKDGTEWEDADTRRERKKTEGLKKKAEKLSQQKTKAEAEGSAPDLLMDPDFT